MKKILITLLIISVALTSVFAIDGLKVGAETGYTRYGMVVKTSNTKTTLGVNGFTFAGVAEYQVVDGVDVVAKVGLDIYGKAHAVLTVGGATVLDEYGDTVPVHFISYVGGKYTYKINSQFSAYAGLGLDFMVGKLDSDEEKADIFLGLKGELAGKYVINDRFAVTLGTGFTWFFYDNAEVFEEAKKQTKEVGGSWFEYGITATAGVTYSF